MSTTQTDPWVARDLARVAVFAALIVVLGVVGPIPVPGLVPITAQTLGVMLAGAVLGWKRGAAAVGIVLVLVAVGLPVLAGGGGGFGSFFGATGGYLIGWLFGAAAIGAIAHSGRISWWRIGLGTIVGGIPVIYAFGLPVQSLVAGQPLGVSALQSLTFLPGDLIKVVVATFLSLVLARAYPPAFPASVRAKRPSSAPNAA